MRTQTRPVAKGTRDVRFPHQQQTVIRFEEDLFAKIRERAIREETSFCEQVRILCEWELESARREGVT